MAIALTSSPAPFSFSGDQIKAVFTVTDIYDQAGSFAINQLPLPSTMTAGATYTLSYGGKSVVFTVATAPDDSGRQIKSRANTAEYSNDLQADLFRANYLLQQDFVIAGYAGGVQFIAKKKGIGLNITGYTVAAGTKEIIKPNLSVYFILYCENESNIGWTNVYESVINIQFGDENIAEAIIGDKLDNYISAEIRNKLPDIPGIDPLLCKKSCRRYYFEYAMRLGTTPTVQRLHKSEQFTVLHGALSTLGEFRYSLSGLINPVSGFKRFLKQGGQLNATRSNQKQYLYYFNAQVNFDAQLKCRLRFTDGTRTIITRLAVAMQQHRKYAFDVSYNSVFLQSDYPGKTLMAYDLWINDGGNTQVSESQTFILDYRHLQYPRYFNYWSSWGAFESILFYGKGNSKFELSQSVAEKSDYSPSDFSKGQSLVYNVSAKSQFEVNTGFVKDRRAQLLNRDFFRAALKYRSIDDLLIPVMVTTKVIDENPDGTNLYAQKFEYEHLYTDTAYTEGDIQDQGIIYQDSFPPYGIYLTDEENRFLVTVNNEYLTL